MTRDRILNMTMASATSGAVTASLSEASKFTTALNEVHGALVFCVVVCGQIVCLLTY